MTLNEIRSNGYWIINGVFAVGSYISNCFFVGSYEDQLKLRKWPIFQKIVSNQHLLSLIAQLTFSVPGK